MRQFCCWLNRCTLSFLESCYFLVVLFFTHSPCIYPFLNFMSFAFHIPQPFPAFSRAERIPVWAQLLYKQKVAGIFFTGRSKLLDVSCFITTVCQLSPSKTCEGPSPSSLCRRPMCWQLLWSSWLQAVRFCGRRGAASSRLPRADELAGQSKLQW